MTHLRERVWHKRKSLHCAVTLWNPRDGTVLELLTDDISCRGFCCGCSCTQPFVIDDEYYATIEIGRKGNGSAEMDLGYLLLNCRVEVAHATLDVRCDRSQVAFFIREYFITPVPSNWRASEAPARLELQRSDIVQM